MTEEIVWPVCEVCGRVVDYVGPCTQLCCKVRDIAKELSDVKAELAGLKEIVAGQFNGTPIKFESIKLIEPRAVRLSEIAPDTWFEWYPGTSPLQLALREKYPGKCVVWSQDYTGFTIIQWTEFKIHVVGNSCLVIPIDPPTPEEITQLKESQTP